MARYFMGDTRLAGLERMMMDPSRTAATRSTDTRQKRHPEKTPSSRSVKMRPYEREIKETRKEGGI